MNLLAVEFHSVDCPWWGDLAVGLPKPLIQDGFITVPDRPGLGIEDLDDEVIAACEKAGVTLYFTGNRHFFH